MTNRIEHWLLALFGLVGLVSVLLAVAPRTAVTAPHLAAASIDANASAEPDGRPTEACPIPGDGGDEPLEEGRATLDSETDDDEDTHSDASTAAPWSKSVLVLDGRRAEWCSRPLADTGSSLVSTGLARGPPIAS